MRKLLATLFAALSIGGIFASAPSASADDVVTLHLDSVLGDDPQPEELVCVTVHVRIGAQKVVWISEPVCV